MTTSVIVDKTGPARPGPGAGPASGPGRPATATNGSTWPGPPVGPTGPQPGPPADLHKPVPGPGRPGTGPGQPGQDEPYERPWMRRAKKQADTGPGRADTGPDDPKRARLIVRLERFALLLVAAAGGCAMYFSGWSMWHVIEDKFGLTDPWQILPMFLLFDIAGVACAVLAFLNLLATKRRGWAYPLVWVFAVASGLMSASDGTNDTSRAMRFAAPVVVAILFELYLSYRHHADTGDENWLLKLLQPLRAKWGLLDPKKTNTEAARAAAVGKLATLAYDLHQLPQETKKERKRRAAAEKLFLKNLRAAVERFELADDDAMLQSVRAGVAVMHGAIQQTAPGSLDDVNPWTRAHDAVTASVEADRLRLQLEADVAIAAAQAEAERARTERDIRLAEIEQQALAAERAAQARREVELARIAADQAAAQAAAKAAAAAAARRTADDERRTNPNPNPDPAPNGNGGVNQKTFAEDTESLRKLAAMPQFATAAPKRNEIVEALGCGNGKGSRLVARIAEAGKWPVPGTEPLPVPTEGAAA